MYLTPTASRRLGRRHFLRAAAGLSLAPVGLSLLTGCGVRGPQVGPAAGEPPPETTRIRLVKIPANCVAAEYVAEDLLKSEGFTDVGYVVKAGTLGKQQAVATGEADLTLYFAAPIVMQVDAGDPVVALAGVHVGCFELFGANQVRAIKDLKGRTVAIPEIGSAAHVFLASMAASVGLNPQQDIIWDTRPPAESMQLLAEGKIDAFLGFPPEPQELRAKKVGYPVVNSAVDKPWSQYFCCMLMGNREFIRKNPVATKRAARAILKAADICAQQPERAAQILVERGYATSPEFTLQLMKDLPYDKWRDYDPEDTIRFYALRLQEAGMIKSSPQKIIADGTDWRFLNELKKELKA